MLEKKIKMDNEKISAENIILEVMRHFGFRRNYQVAKYFDVTPQTLSGWIKNGEIPPKHLIKFKEEILTKKNKNIEKINNEYLNDSFVENYKNETNEEFSFKKIKKLFFNNIKVLIIIPLSFLLLTIVYLTFFANPVYTSKSKVLPISEDGATSSSFTGFASQLGINIPLSIGGKVPWDEIYPEIVKSSGLLESLLEKKYNTIKYGNISLKKILINENGLDKYEERNQQNRVLDKLKEMIKISKERTSPIVNINVLAFEPFFAAELSNDLISSSSTIQRQLKTKRIKQKRLFIEERLDQVSLEMKKMEQDLRRFRENNRNLSTSPSLQMRVQEMGREVDLQNNLYITLKTQYEKAKIDEVGRDDMVQKIDGPSIPTRLTSPKKTLSILMAFFIGLFSAFFVVYLKENFLSKM